MRRILLISTLIIISLGCSNIKIDDVYRYYMGKIDNCDVWIVDGNLVRLKFYNSFLYGGNEQRYPFNPKGEIWIDNAISCEEYNLTLVHELNERHLMGKLGWTYYSAHDSSLRVEQVMRKQYEEVCRNHETTLKKVAVTDYNNIKQIPSIPDSIQLQNIYRLPLGNREGLDIWIVDGYLIRKNIYPDFGFSGNDLSYHFIPKNEIWIDGQVSCEETEYSIATEIHERKLMVKGESYNDAYYIAINRTLKMRQDMNQLARSHFKLSIPDSLTRYQGVIDSAN